MLYKSRNLPKTLKILRSLNLRTELNAEDKRNYLNLEKGYEGECLFDSYTNQLTCDCLILNDLQLVCNNSPFQIDTLMIFQENLLLFEIKNYCGDFCYDPESFQLTSGKEVKNPFDQLKRCRSLLRQLFQSLGVHIPIEGFVVFVNPAFTLYQAPKDIPAIFPTQLNYYLKKLGTKRTQLKTFHKNLADKLITIHDQSQHLFSVPQFQYECGYWGEVYAL